jgi:hypothetical protein
VKQVSPYCLPERRRIDHVADRVEERGIVAQAGSEAAREAEVAVVVIAARLKPADPGIGVAAIHAHQNVVSKEVRYDGMPTERHRHNVVRHSLRPAAPCTHQSRLDVHPMLHVVASSHDFDADA